jgi:hypothetical protein
MTILYANGDVYHVPEPRLPPETPAEVIERELNEHAANVLREKQIQHARKILRGLPATEWDAERCR